MVSGLVYPHLSAESGEADMATALTDRSNKEAILRFSAKIDQINMIPDVFIAAENEVRSEYAEFDHSERRFL